MRKQINRPKIKWLKWSIIIIIIVVVLLVVIGLIIALIESQSSSGSLSREVICNNEKASCDNNCDTNLISYFCKKDCAEQWQQCIGYG